MLWHYTHTLDPYRRIASNQPALEVLAVGLDWKWLFIYPTRSGYRSGKFDNCDRRCGARGR
ncbi:MAG: hypothetical protein B7X09_00120 [Acidiphilium sp. 21-66-27]|uniref:Cytochrome oxidase subunit II copper A binding domain-containing protein n=1 Tax=Acidiphilium cryptum (strain JF-5) TaxID=349163 RepID=A5FT26_ACICJ|nr:hypothetical protein Acry_3131 [Acidiphilium cryptum JF-5]OYV54740.1 MAG: hypothetical protein B7Z76_13370 [Acidiphilium sp. 20-67-58]OYV67810.1 MAG: hypothetical protein B7X09_00120 [Acidiphilium sp. 21-66-27]